jgi:hypothetical protein
MPIEIVTLQHSSHATILRQTPGSSCIWYMPYNRVIQQPSYVRTVDSDVVVLSVRFFDTLGLSELWVGFGTGKRYRDIPVHVLNSNLGPSKLVSRATPLPQLNWVRHNFAVPCLWQEDCLGSLDQFTGPHRHISGSHERPHPLQYRFCAHAADCTLRCPYVQQGLWRCQSERSEASSLHQWKQIIGKPLPYPSRSIRACETIFIAGQFLLG